MGFILSSIPTMKSTSISVSFLALLLSACATPIYQDTGTSITLKDLINNEWQLPWDGKSNDISINSEFGMRVSTYSKPPFIHNQWIQPIASLSKRLDGLCKRQHGTFNYFGLNKLNTSIKPLAHSYEYNQEVAQIEAQSKFKSMQDTVQAMEIANQKEFARQMSQAYSSIPDGLTQEAINDITRAKWLGDYSCESATEKWTASIKVKDWRAAFEKGMDWRYLTLTTTINKL